MPVGIRRASRLAEMGMFAAEKEGRTGFPFFTWVRVEARRSFHMLEDCG